MLAQGAGRGGSGRRTLCVPADILLRAQPCTVMILIGELPSSHHGLVTAAPASALRCANRDLIAPSGRQLF